MINIKLIVAAAENNVIGKDNKMPWHLPNDFKYFKKITLDHSIVMGRKTFDAIGKALPERRNIILTRDQHFVSSEVDVANSVAEVLTYCRDERDVFVIGGANVYSQFLSLATEVYLTRVHTVVDGDAFFSELSTNEWKLVSQENHGKDEKHAFDYTFEIWKRV